jgi:hypothetical protein
MKGRWQMEQPIEVIEYRGFNINVYPDFDPINPCEEWEFLGKMVCWHNRYELGHEQPKCDPDEYLKDLAIEADSTVEDRIDYWENGPGWIRILNKRMDEDDVFNSSDECTNKVNSIIQKTIDKYYIMLPLYLYDHSGLTIQTSPFSCPWDSGMVGFVYVSIKAVKKEWNWKVLTKSRRQNIIDILVSEVNSYDDYLTGSVYGYTIEPTDKNKSIACDDSCWGYFGYDLDKSGLLSDAKSNIDYAIEKYKKECIENHQRRMQMNSFMQCCWAY